MSIACNIRPSIKKKIIDSDGVRREVEVDSNLWQDIYEYTNHNRSLTKNLYALLHTDFVKLFKNKIQYDENGEVVFDSIKDLMHTQRLLDDEENLNRCLVKYGIIDPKTKEPKEFTNPVDAIEKANQFNEECETHSATPYIETRGKIKIRTAPSGYGVDFVKKNLAFQSVLNYRIIEFLNQLGFQISFGDLGDSRYNGLFLPEGAKKLTDGLIDIIRVSNSKEGAAAIPEEFAHLLIEGLRHTPLVIRLLENLNSQYDPEHKAIRTILGDMFDTYDDLYRNGLNEPNWEMLSKEAAGKLLAKALTGQSIYDGTYDSFDDNKMQAPTTFIGRIIAFIKSIFKRVDENYIRDLVVDCQQRVDFISNQFTNNREDLFREVKLRGLQDILNSKNMYETQQQITEFQKILYGGERLVKQLYFNERNRIFSGDFSLVPENGLNKRNLQDAYERWKDETRSPKERTDAYNLFKDIANDVMGKWWDSIEDIRNFQKELSEPQNNIDQLAALSLSISISLDFLNRRVNILQSEFNKVNTTPDVTKMKDLSEILVHVKKVINAFNEFSALSQKIKDLEEYQLKEYKEKNANNWNIDNQIIQYKEKFDETLHNIVTHVGGFGADLQNTYNNLSKQLLTIMVKQYLPNGYKITTSDGNEEVVDAESIVDIANSELSMFDRLTKGMYQCSDYLLNILNNIFVDQQDLVRQKLIATEQGIRALQEALEKAGYNTKFMYELDDNGHKTGRYISNYNFDLWQSERKKKFDELDELVKNNQRQKSDADQEKVKWDAIHSRLVRPDDPNSLVPNLNYKDENGVYIYNTHKLDALSEAQRSYYDEFMQFKAKIDSKYPLKSTHLYSCIWILRDNDERKLDFLKTGNLKQAAKDWWNWKKEAFTLREDDADYVTGQKVQIDIDGTPIRRVPVKYTCSSGKLEHISQETKDQLSEDASSCLLAYMAAGENYNVCNSLINQYLVAEDFIRNVRKSPIEQGYQIIGNKKQQIQGKSTAAADRLSAWIKATMEGNRKDLQEWRFGDYVINFGMLADRIRNFTTEYRLSFNPVTGAMNIVDETVQAAIEAFDGRFFNHKEYTEAEAECANMGLEHLMHIYDANPDDMLSLVIKTFDLNDDYIESLREGNIKNSTLERVYGTNFTHMFMHLGEMHNHTVPGVAHLKHIKAIDASGKEVPLFSCLEKLRYKISDGKYAYRLVFKNGTKLKLQSNRFEGGEKILDFTRNFSEKDLENMSLSNPEVKNYIDQLDSTFGYLSNSIKQVNRRMNGAMATVDAGLMERHFLGRMVLQFRKWQISYMTNRFGNSFIGSDGKIHEAYWQFGIKYTWNQLKGVFYRMTNQMDEHKNYRRMVFSKLSDSQKGYIKRAAAEFTLFWLGILASAYLGGDWSDGGGDDDKKNKKKTHPYDNTPFEGVGRFLYMLTIRGTLEVGASIPTFSMLDSMAKIFKDPIPSLQNIRQMIRFVNPGYIAVHINKDASEERWGITNDYVQKLVSTSMPQIRQAWNAYDLFMTDSEKPFRWFEMED